MSKTRPHCTNFRTVEEYLKAVQLFAVAKREAKTMNIAFFSRMSGLSRREIREFETGVISPLRKVSKLYRILSAYDVFIEPPVSRIEDKVSHLFSNTHIPEIAPEIKMTTIALYDAQRKNELTVSMLFEILKVSSDDVIEFFEDFLEADLRPSIDPYQRPRLYSNNDSFCDSVSAYAEFLREDQGFTIAQFAKEHKVTSYRLEVFEQNLRDNTTLESFIELCSLYDIIKINDGFSISDFVREYKAQRLYKVDQSTIAQDAYSRAIRTGRCSLRLFLEICRASYLDPFLTLENQSPYF